MADEQPAARHIDRESHSGAWAAEIDGNFNIFETFEPVPVSALVTVDLWAWHPPNGGGMAIDLLYVDDSGVEFLIDQTKLEGWRHFDFLADLDPEQSIKAIVAFGYGFPNIGHTTRFDDLRICRTP